MNYCELFVSPSTVFGGFQKNFGEADYVVVGVPFDLTSTYRSGARFAPLAIREASLNLETYSFRAGIDAEGLRLCDLGDLHVVGEVDETLRQLKLVTKDIFDAKKTPVIIGGEHTITLGAVEGIGKNVAIVSFDAHLDLRSEYMGRTVCHTTFLRRINEKLKPKKILEVGTRAVCKEELNYAKKFNIQYSTVQQIREDGLEKTLRKIEKILDGCKNIYLTIDMDVLDPAFAPAVQNPEPDGLCAHTFFDILSKVCEYSVIAFDLVEVAPHYDQGITAIQAAKTMYEVLSHIEKARRG